MASPPTTPLLPTAVLTPAKALQATAHIPVDGTGTALGTSSNPLTVTQTSTAPNDGIRQQNADALNLMPNVLLELKRIRILLEHSAELDTSDVSLDEDT